ncbi:MAG: sigma-70 family RNA polymerase sigma factor [Lachnospiraceae bacterium]|nr:sigma-70 family RNA polymerase sigma factor [Lachnospiraceae bacterium]
MEDARTSYLVSMAKVGDIDAFEELIKNSEKIVYNICFRMLLNPEDAKDISQEVFIKIYNNIDKYNYMASFSTWVYRIAVNTCIDEIRRKKKEKEDTVFIENDIPCGDESVKPQYISKEPTPEDRVINKEKNNEIISAVNKLSEEHKNIIMLRDLMGLSYIEISETLDISIGTVKSRIARARKGLRDVLFAGKEQKAVNSRHNS